MKRNKTINRLAACLLLAALCLTGCAGQRETETVRVATLMGPTGMGMAKLISDSGSGLTEGSYSFSVASSPDQITPTVISGDTDIAAVPVNLAAALYQKTEGNVQVIGINTLGVLYVLENGDTVHSVSDLRGKTLYATGQGSTPEYILEYLLRRNGLEPGTDLTVEYLSEHTELAAKLVSGDAALGMLPEPNVTAALSGNGSLRVALDLTEEWRSVSEYELAQGCVIVTRSFAEAHPEAVEAFLREYADSVTYAAEHPSDAAKLIEAAGIMPKAAVAEKALPNCNLCLITGTEMRDTLGAMLQLLYDVNPRSVGGALPDEAFYR